eukprot:13308227-Ditylum_brightwellii.AAC.1
MEKDTVDELVHNTPTQCIAVGNDGSLPGEVGIHDSNQDNDDCSLLTLSNSDLSLTTKPYQELGNDFYCNENYFKHFCQVPQNYSDCPPMPDIKTRKYVFLYKDNMHVTDIDNMS